MQRGIQKNKLLRYQSILDLYLEKKTEDIPDTVIWRKYIYPTFHISRRTLVTILGTPVNKELKEIKAVEDAQISLFPSDGTP
ncbi:MAG: hypothetical protein JJE55_08180 [Flavobacteriaceae bacterium]|nr:hypothetical protein [Flavobacteriaceae bacterium]